MRIPYSWLQELVPGLPSPQATADLLTGVGLSVEEMLELPGAPADVVLVRIEQVAHLEGADDVSLVRVTDGAREHQVICGAANLHVGMVAVLAKPGSRLPEHSEPIRARKMWGHRSEGMLCSAQELGLYADGAKVLSFAADTTLGAELSELWPGETVLVLELTPNRADAFSLLGVARDLGAKLDRSIRHPLDGVTPAERGGIEIAVDVVARDACPRFTLRLIDEVRVGPSPVWLQRRLAALGLHPRNNIVDVTNYVTFELGQPSHAYDREALGDKVVVRTAEAGERLRALGDQELVLDSADVVIAAGSLPAGLGGVIGGVEHSVGVRTTRIALEVAHFESVTVRRTAKRHKLVTDAHYRFERGVDPNLPPLASARIAQLMEEVSGGKAQPVHVDTGENMQRPAVTFSPARVEALTALEVTPEDQWAFLTRLGCGIEQRTPQDWRVTPPSWRFDLGLEADLVEEVARLYGYEHIPATVPTLPFVPSLTDPTHRRLRERLAAIGFQELMNYVFVSERDLQEAGAPEARVRLQSPQSAERAVLRTSLRPGLLASARRNRAARSNAFFEIGRVFRIEETERLGLLMRGEWIEQTWLPGQPVDFFVLKGVLERLAGAAGAELELVAGAEPGLHPGVSARVLWQGRDVGIVGRVHPQIERSYGIGETYVAELMLPLDEMPRRYNDYSRQPAAERDLAILVPRTTPFDRLARVVREAAGGHLLDVAPFDVYEGERVPAGQRSVALRLRFQHPVRALRDAEVEEAVEAIRRALIAQGYALRAH